MSKPLLGTRFCDIAQQKVNNSIVITISLFIYNSQNHYRRDKHNSIYFAYMALSNVINLIAKLNPLSIIKLVVKKKAASMVQLLSFVGMGRLRPLDALFQY